MVAVGRPGKHRLYPGAVRDRHPAGFRILAAPGRTHRDFGQGAVRWYSLGFAALQPSEFLKPVFVVFSAWMIAASQELGGPPGKTVSLLVTGILVGFLALQPDFGQAALLIFAWG
jgi:cell division protein FtsW